MLQEIIQGNLVPRMLYYSSLSGSRRRVGEDPGNAVVNQCSGLCPAHACAKIAVGLVL